MTQKKLVRKIDHPTLPLTISKYTKTAFHKRKWTEEVINSRGHVHDTNGNLVSCPFTKFFNLNETMGTRKDHVVDLISSHYHEAEVHIKYNGHLGILFNYQGEWINTTSGSFEHDFIKPDRNIIDENGFTPELLDRLPSSWTLIFEIIGEHDPHVMTPIHQQELGRDSAAVLLGVYDSTTRQPVDNYENTILSIWSELGCNTYPLFAKKHNFRDLVPVNTKEAIGDFLDEMKKWEDMEGVILHVPSIDYRVKIKTDWFIKHRYMRQFDHAKTKELFVNLFDSEKAFTKIPEELHEAYETFIGQYRTFESSYKNTIMDTGKRIVEAFKTRDLMNHFIDTTTEIKTEAEREVIKSYLNGDSDSDRLMRNIFAENIENFSLIDQYMMSDT